MHRIPPRVVLAVAGIALKYKPASTGFPEATYRDAAGEQVWLFSRAVGYTSMP
jgi:hypothetical protein